MVFKKLSGTPIGVCKESRRLFTDATASRRSASPGRSDGRAECCARCSRSPPDPMCGLAGSERSIAPSNGMDAKRSTGARLSSPAAVQRCAEGAGLDSGAPTAEQSARPSIALPFSAHIARGSTNAAAPVAPQLHPESPQLNGRDPGRVDGAIFEAIFNFSDPATEATVVGS
jgi:hypothetical protein